MRRTLNIFFFLMLILGTSYYLYIKNLDFNKFVNDLAQNFNPRTSDSLSIDIEPLQQNDYKKSKARVPKVKKPDKFYALDEYARKTPKKYTIDISTLSQYLVKPAKSDIEKARVLFTWISKNIKYDDKAYNSNDYPDYSAINVLQSKKAVCEGYSNIFKALCEAAGLESEKVIGYSKGYGYNVGDKFYETTHTWNAIKVDNRWSLFDVTWASSSGKTINGKLVTKSRFDPSWFDVNPKMFVFTHLPKETKWQLTDNPITLDKFERLPRLSMDFFNLGFNPDQIYNDAMLGKVQNFAITYPTDFPINASQLPYAQYLGSSKAIVFEIKSDYAEEIALIDGKSWHYFSKKDGVFTLTHKPTAKDLEICIKINWFDKNFNTILQYKVIHKNNATAANITHTSLGVL